MGRKLDAFLGRKFKTSKFKATVNLAVSRLAVLKNKPQARLTMTRSDVVQLLTLGHHEHALHRVDQMIKEQNMLDVYVMLDAPRCGEFPELQEIRAILTARYGKEFANGAIELRSNCGVSTRMIQKLSPRKSSLEIRMKILNEIAAENDIVLKLDDSSPVLKKGEGESKTNVIETNPSVSADDFDEVMSFTESMKGRKEYRNVEDAAQAAPNTRPRKVLEKSKLEIPEPESGHEHEVVNVEAADETSKNNMKDTNGNDLIVDKPLENNVVFDESDNEIENEPVGFMSSKQLERNAGNIEPQSDKGSKVHQLDLTKRPISVRKKRVFGP
ncbi:hypothetical protein CTI12_AA107790 [Artemisia annua]|uniref:Uncharacterized protein n=1 Tax=Artemisia annua TaxID=35608 RepID=A0A2U1PVM0_ARTAN|nr:hypothetical protein CTI12_AA107790 [Artemisia annua]